MKKIIIIVMIVLALIELTSCNKKDYVVTCKCNDIEYGDVFETRKEAKAYKKWQELQPMYDIEDQTIEVENNIRCEIKTLKKED